MSFFERLQISLRSWKSTLSGFLPLLGAILIALGWIDLEQQTVVIDGVETIIDSADSLLNELIAILGAASGIGLIFSKDGDKKSEDVGL